MKATEHRVGEHSIHNQWDNRLPPAAIVRSGDTVHFTTQEVSGGQVRYGGPAEVMTRLDRTRSYPLAGPVYVEGAMPGDILEAELLELRPGEWGWTAIIPGRGLLAQDFPEPYIKYFELGTRTRAELKPGVSIPIAPFCGTIGVAPAEAGALPVSPPHQGGGNIDTKQLTRGTKLYLPVLVEGALFSVGDCHAAQGDGEVCITGLECDMAVVARLTIVKGRSLPASTYQMSIPPGRPSPPVARFGSSAIGPDLMEDARNAVRGLIGWLEREQRLTRQDAYVLCSLAADLRMSQLVNAPNYCVTALLPLSVFDSDAPVAASDHMNG